MATSALDALIYALRVIEWTRFSRREYFKKLIWWPLTLFMTVASYSVIVYEYCASTIFATSTSNLIDASHERGRRGESDMGEGSDGSFEHAMIE